MGMYFIGVGLPVHAQHFDVGTGGLA